MRDLFELEMAEALTATGTGFLLLDENSKVVGYNSFFARCFDLTEQQIGADICCPTLLNLSVDFARALAQRQGGTRDIDSHNTAIRVRFEPYLSQRDDALFLAVTAQHLTSNRNDINAPDTGKLTGAEGTLIKQTLTQFERLPPPHKLYVLVVDDDDDSRYLLINNLQATNACQYSVAVADSAEQAYTMMQNERYDVCITDFRLLDDTAIELHQRISLLPYSPPFIVVTNYPEDTLYAKLLSTGITDLITKSNLTPELINRSVRYAVQKHQLSTAMHQIVGTQ